MKHSLVSLAAQLAAGTAEVRALREELAVLRERVAVLEKRPMTPAIEMQKFQCLPVIGSPAPHWVTSRPTPARITC